MNGQTSKGVERAAGIGVHIGIGSRLAALAGLNARLQDILTQKDMPNVSFEVVAVDDLSVNPRTRKFQLIVDDREATPA